VPGRVQIVVVVALAVEVDIVDTALGRFVDFDDLHT
jgi:hypothetical protein